MSSSWTKVANQWKKVQHSQKPYRPSFSIIKYQSNLRRSLMLLEPLRLLHSAVTMSSIWCLQVPYTKYGRLSDQNRSLYFYHFTGLAYPLMLASTLTLLCKLQPLKFTNWTMFIMEWLVGKRKLFRLISIWLVMTRCGSLITWEPLASFYSSCAHSSTCSDPSYLHAGSRDT